jgi:hypothetical protein
LRRSGRTHFRVGCTAEPDVIDMIRWVKAATQCDANVVLIAIPTAPTQHPIITNGCSKRVAFWRNAIVVTLVPVTHPFKHIASHIHHAIRARTCRETAHPTGIVHAKAGVVSRIIVSSRAVCWLVAPRILARVTRSARRLLPFGFAGKSLASPGSIVAGVIPRDIDHRIVGIFGIAIIGRPSVGRVISWWCAGSSIYALGVLGIGYFILIDIVSIQVDGVQGLLI